MDHPKPLFGLPFSGLLYLNIKLILILICLASSHTIFCQEVDAKEGINSIDIDTLKSTNNTYEITGRVTNDAGIALEFANIALYESVDSTLVKV